MVSVSIQHIIGTVALIALTVSAGLFFTIFTSAIQQDNRQAELQQISDNVALNIEEIINIVKFEAFSSLYSNYTVKLIDLPTSVGGQPYKVQLVKAAQTTIESYLSNQQTINANSTIPMNSAGTALVVNSSLPVYPIVVGAEKTTIDCSGAVFGHGGIAIWAYPVWNNPSVNAPSTITVGLGWVKSQVGGA